MYRKTLIVIFISLLFLGCEFKAGNEQAFKRSNPEYMENFMALMDKRNVPYNYIDGYIRYKNDVKSQVEEIERLLSQTKSIQFKNEKVRRYFQSVLKKEGIEFLELSKENGTWTMWWPLNEEQEKEIQLKTVGYAFDNNLHKDM